MPNFVAIQDAETSQWLVINAETGTVARSGLPEQQAILQAQNLSIGVEPDDPFDGFELASAATSIDETNLASVRFANRDTRINETDWRVRLKLSPFADYLYSAPDPGILEPLKATDGVVFPYTPRIDSIYHANYTPYDLTHSNFRGYFYQNSYVGEILLQVTFTAQDSREAEYMLATIHFFKSITKMFYGQDEQRGTPPPVVYLSGLGEYQFNEHPLLVSQFNYNLPPDVDYIRAGGRDIMTTAPAQDANARNSGWLAQVGGAALGQFNGTVARLLASRLNPGAEPKPLSSFTPNTLGTRRNGITPTYVPTKIDISLVLLPIQSRRQVSEQFSLRDFANGSLLRRGYW